MDNPETEIKPDCFILMPIADPEGYTKGHFKHVYEDILAPACVKAGFQAIRADDIKQTNLIHLDVLQKIIEAPMALCDLSSRNPNVLFELGLRQAFDKPVVLVREIGTLNIFDIAPLRYTEYRKERVYHEVLEDQENIANAIKATNEAFEKGQGINSIVKLLSLTKPATLADVQEADKDPVLQIIRAELSELRSEFRTALLARDTMAYQVSPSQAKTPTYDRLLEIKLENTELLLRVDTEIEALSLVIEEMSKTNQVTPRPLRIIKYLRDMLDSIAPEKDDQDSFTMTWFDLKRKLKLLELRFREVEREVSKA